MRVEDLKAQGDVAECDKVGGVPHPKSQGATGWIKRVSVGRM
jgi:hypothetical protein